MKCNCYDDKKANHNIAPFFDNTGTYSNSDCNMPVRRRLEPILVARIYNQPIVEELPYSAMSLTMDNTATISNVCSETKPECCDYGYDDRL